MSAASYRLLGYHELPLRVRFGEVDHYGYLWHGHLLAYFESLRSDVARRFGLRTSDLLEEELILPMVELSCLYKHPAFEDDHLRIQGTLLKPSIPLPFLVFIYRVVKHDSGTEIVRARTRQVFMRPGGRLITRVPDTTQHRMTELWGYLAAQPRWQDADEVVHSLARAGGEHVICDS